MQPPPAPPPPPPPEPPASFDLSRRDLQWIAKEVNIFKIMGERKTRSVTVDFVPGRPAIALPRLPGDEPLKASPPHVEEITFHLEDTQLGGEVFATLTCRGMVLVQPFMWDSWDSLTKYVINVH